MGEDKVKRIFTSVEKAHSRYYEAIFKISLNKTSEFFVPRLYLENASTDEAAFITSENFTSIFMERLGLLGVHDVDMYEEVCSSNGLKYIFECYRELNIAVSKERTSGGPAKGFIIHCENLCFSFAASLLTEPDIFLFGSSAESHLLSLVSDPMFPPFFEGIYKNVNADVNMAPLYASLLHSVFMELGEISVENDILNPKFNTFADLLMFYVEKEPLAKILVDSPYWFGDWKKNASFHGRTLEHDTVLGQILRPSFFSMDDKGRLVRFQGINGQEEVSSSLVALVPAWERYIRKVVSILQKLLAKVATRPKVLLWFHKLAKVNKDRVKPDELYQLPLKYSSLQLCVNATLVVLHILAPMEKNIPLLSSRIELDYLRMPRKIRDPILGEFQVVFDEPSMIPKPEGEKKQSLLEPEEKRFSFQTEWLFLTMLLIRSCYVPVFKEYLNLESYFYENHDTAWLAADFESVQRRAVLFGQRTLFKNFFLLASIKKYSKIVSELFLYKINPGFLDYDKEFDSKRINIDILSEETVSFFQRIPDTLLMDASYLFESAICFYIENSIESLSEFQPILSLLSILIGRKTLLHNPHHRAELAKYIADVLLFYTRSNNRRDLAFFDRVLSEKCLMSTVIQHFIPHSFMQIFIDIEFTGGTDVFYQKFTYRYSMYIVLKHALKSQNMRARFIELASEAKPQNSEKLPLFFYFINLLTNDTIFLMDESLKMLMTIREFEDRRMTEEFKNLRTIDKESEIEKYHKDRFVCKQYNTLSWKNMVQVKRITKLVIGPFIDNLMIEKMAAMLNYIYSSFVSNKQSKYKVSRMNELKFDPRKILFTLSKIYRNLAIDKKFVECVASEGRSYSPELFENAVSRLRSLQCKFSLLKVIEGIYRETESIFMNKKLSGIDLSDVPKEFTDVIMCEIMLDPVLLPTSNVVLDRTTITRYLLSNEEDPFNRQHLTINMLVPQPELKAKIHEWIATKRNNP